jgi:hypothetical protein
MEEKHAITRTRQTDNAASQNPATPSNSNDPSTLFFKNLTKVNIEASTNYSTRFGTINGTRIILENHTCLNEIRGGFAAR